MYCFDGQFLFIINWNSFLRYILFTEQNAFLSEPVGLPVECVGHWWRVFRERLSSDISRGKESSCRWRWLQWWSSCPRLIVCVLPSKFSDVINGALDEYFPLDSGVQIIAEPGRYYVETVFTLATNVVAKRVVMDDMRKDEGKFLIGLRSNQNIRHKR